MAAGWREPLLGQHSPRRVRGDPTASSPGSRSGPPWGPCVEGAERPQSPFLSDRCPGLDVSPGNTEVGLGPARALWGRVSRQPLHTGAAGQRGGRDRSGSSALRTQARRVSLGSGAPLWQVPVGLHGGAGLPRMTTGAWVRSRLAQESGRAVCARVAWSAPSGRPLGGDSSSASCGLSADGSLGFLHWTRVALTNV